MRIIAAALVLLVGLSQALWAQSRDDVVWVQVEAQPSLSEATARARAYAAELQDVNGFSLGTGWYGIALGPYTRSDAEQVLRVYRREGVIPSDSYIAFSSSYRQQFWPVGANLLDRGVLQAPAAPPETAPEAIPEATAEAAPQAPGDSPAAAEPTLTVTPADETPREAQQSERLLTRADRESLQIALQWAGFYDAAIDGAFGRGTRNSMAAWQEANGYDVTGILTTVQRAALLKQYNAVLDGLGLQLVRDEAVGIEMKLPTEVVAFDRYEPPFAHYTAIGDIDAKVLLISQAGDRDTLFGLYDIMQTLEIVPLNGPRERSNDSFVLIGEDAMTVSETRVRLLNGRIKGFTLVWPAGDEDRRRRLIAEMDKSLVRLGTVLDPAAGANDQQSIDLLAGLDIRKPRMTRSGFYVDAGGTVATSADVVEGCGRITLDDDHEARVLTQDAARGLALLRPATALAPAGVAAFSTQTPRLQSEVAVSGYSYGGVLSAPSVTFGTLADLRGLQGEAGLNRLALTALPGDAGGPVFDAGGGVLGMLLPRPEGDRALPENVSFALDRTAIGTLMAETGLSATNTDSTAAIAPQDLTDRAVDMTVLVSCWD
ncbi:serine protease [Sulfitobacter sabulilitoris]|uniref:Peptidoglycan-binding protein n=1 Tax=Sulfitobacter sabulilitoris TaxID=2562655 RepID=A0A5S3PB28_9RHOB|nr:serine protease [Sulfitobacter sabulilitoris]TMM50798.1 peptidoglycan-binding protein [Sulfitobacter sabulilitoris]